MASKNLAKLDFQDSGEPGDPADSQFPYQRLCTIPLHRPTCILQTESQNPGRGKFTLCRTRADLTDNVMIMYERGPVCLPSLGTYS